MLVKDFEERIAPDIKWEKVEDIPNLSHLSFDEVKKKIGANEYSIGIDYNVSLEVAKWLYGPAYRTLFFLLTWTPYIMSVVAIVLAFILGNYWLLFGVVICVAGLTLANPMFRSRKFFTIVAGILFLVFLYGLWQGKETITYLSAFFLLSFFITRYTFSMTQGRLKRVALESEKIFIFLYQRGKLGLRNNKSGETYWYSERTK